MTIESTRKYANDLLLNINKKEILLYPRDKNLDFINKYSLSNEDIKYIVNSITIEQFKGRIPNKDKKIHSKYLYIFKTIVELEDEYGVIFGYVYIKICEIKPGILVVSIHIDE